jgi:hypothetical protein
MQTTAASCGLLRRPCSRCENSEVVLASGPPAISDQDSSTAMIVCKVTHRPGEMKERKCRMTSILHEILAIIVSCSVPSWDRLSGLTAVALRLKLFCSIILSPNGRVPVSLAIGESKIECARC